MRSGSKSWFVCGAALLGLCAPVALAQNFFESEINDSKQSANAFTFTTPGNGPIGTISGVTTGSVLDDPGALASADYFRVTMPDAPDGIYEYTAAVTTTGPVGHTVSIRGLDQITGGFIVAGTDQTIQTSTASGSFTRSVRWYGFGKQEQIYLRVTGTSSTSSDYTLTISRSAVTPAAIAAAPNAFPSGPITVSTIGRGHATNTELHVYNSQFEPVGTFRNDSPVLMGGTLAEAMRSLVPGTYYLALSTTNIANDQASPPDDALRTTDVLDFPGALVQSSSSSGDNVSFFVLAQGMAQFNVNTQKGAPYGINWFSFNVSDSGQFVITSEAAPYSARRGQPLSFRVRVDPSTGNTVTSVQVDLSPLGGTTLALSTEGGSLWSGTTTVPAGAPLGDVQLGVTAFQTGGNSAAETVHVHVSGNPPANDNCESAIAVTTLPATYSVENTFGSDDASPTQLTCNSGSEFSVRQGVWFSWTATGDGHLHISETGNQNTVVAVFEGNSCPELVMPPAINCFADGESNVKFPVFFGRSYRVLIGREGTGTTPSSNPIVVRFDFIPPPPNDLCVDAIEITSLPVSFSIDTASASPDDNLACLTRNVQHGIWFRYTATFTGPLFLNESSSAGFGWAVFTANPADPCNTLTNVFCENISEQTTVNVTQGQLYYILAGDQTNFTSVPAAALSITFDSGLPPVNDACAGAIDVTGLPFSDQKLAFFATDSGFSGGCAPSANDIWYRFVPPESGTYDFSEAGPINSQTTVYQATNPGDHCGSLVQVGCEMLEFSSFPLSAGTPYYIQISRESATAPSIAQQWLFRALPPLEVMTNDVCEGALEVDSPNFMHYTSNDAATPDLPSAPCDILNADGAMQNSIWYRIAPTTSGMLTVVADGDVWQDVYDSVIVLLRALSPANPCSGGFAEVACADNPDPSTISNVPLTAGQVYYLKVGDTGTTADGGETLVTFSYTGNIGTGPTPCQRADFNNSGSVDATDIFIFLDAWFAQNGMSGPNLSADTNDSGNVDATDIFIYLDLWFANNGQTC